MSPAVLKRCKQVTRSIITVATVIRKLNPEAVFVALYLFTMYLYRHQFIALYVPNSCRHILMTLG